MESVHILYPSVWLHQGICHRDIKLENFVFTTKDSLEDIVVGGCCDAKAPETEHRVQVIDFGIGKRTIDVSDKIKPKKRLIKESKGEQKRNMQVRHNLALMRKLTMNLRQFAGLRTTCRLKCQRENMTKNAIAGRQG